MMVRVDVPDPPDVNEILVGFRVALIPVVGAIVSLNPSVPMNPFTLARVIVDVPDAPIGMLTLAGLEAIVKSVTFTITVAEWTMEPEVPVIVIV